MGSRSSVGFLVRVLLRSDLGGPQTVGISCHDRNLPEPPSELWEKGQRYVRPLEEFVVYPVKTLFTLGVVLLVISKITRYTNLCVPGSKGWGGQVD